MTRSVFTFVVGISCVTAGAYLAYRKSSSPPVYLPIGGLIPDREVLDFDDVVQQEAVEGSIRLTNHDPVVVQFGFPTPCFTGIPGHIISNCTTTHDPVPLKISSILKGCGCTSATLSQDSLLPGETAELRIRWD